MSVTSISKPEQVTQDVQKILDLIENLNGKPESVVVAAIEALGQMNAGHYYIE